MAQVSNRGHDDDTGYGSNSAGMGSVGSNREGRPRDGGGDVGDGTSSDSTGDNRLDRLVVDMGLIKECMSVLLGSIISGVNDELAADEARLLRDALSPGDFVSAYDLVDWTKKNWKKKNTSIARLPGKLPYDKNILEDLTKITKEFFDGTVTETERLQDGIKDTRLAQQRWDEISKNATERGYGGLQGRPEDSLQGRKRADWDDEGRGEGEEERGGVQDNKGLEG